MLRSIIWPDCIICMVVFRLKKKNPQKTKQNNNLSYGEKKNYIEHDFIICITISFVGKNK